MSASLHRCFILIALTLLFSACSTVRVRDTSVDEYLATRRGDVLTAGHLSAASRESLLVLGIDDKTCTKDLSPCLNALESARELGDEQRLSALAELHLAHALASDRPGGKSRVSIATLDHYTEAARFSYAYLFLSTRDPTERAFEDRQTQVRDFYNFATERLVRALFAGTGDPATTRAVTLQRSEIRVGEVHLQLPQGAQVPQELIAASSLAVDGIRNTYRRDGVGAAFVAVAGEEPPSTVALHESLYLAATVVLRFEGNTLDEVLHGSSAILDVYDPYRYENLQLAGRDLPLAANFTAPYALWLSRANFRRQAGLALLRASTTLTAPRIYMMQPYDPNRRTIVMLHGLASSPDGWVNLVNEIMGDAQLRRRYQVWQVFYPTNLPIPENTKNIREALLTTLQTLDPEANDRATDHMTLIGHSMGGVIARLLVVDSGDVLWEALFEHPVPEERREHLPVLAPYLTLKPMPHIDRVIFLASPHRGAPMARGWIGRTAMGLVHLPVSALRTLASVTDTIAEELPQQADALRHRKLSSIAYLSDQDRYLRSTSTLRISNDVTYHSIIGRIDPAVPLEQSSDGVVPYMSAHLDGAASETIVASKHSVQQSAQAILAIRRILQGDAG